MARIPPRVGATLGRFAKAARPCDLPPGRPLERVEGMVLAATARNYRGKVTERLWFALTALAMARFGERARLGMHRVAEALGEHPRGMSASEEVIAPWAMAEFRSTSMWSLL